MTGVNSYIGKSFTEWVSKYEDLYSIQFISLKDNLWKNESFCHYDVVLHTAAIVHRKEIDLTTYIEVNKNLTLELAQAAKNQGVGQFIFLSTMGVYGTETGYITNDTKPSPKTPYAQSKLDAEEELLRIESESFKVTILRPPLVYGPGCKGNYMKLSKLINKVPIFPQINNQRSMIYIDNLSEFLRIVIDGNVSGLFFPQNKHYVSTSVLASLISRQNNNQIKKTSLLNPLVYMAMKYVGAVRKVFGSFQYARDLPGSPDTTLNGIKFLYETIEFEKTIAVTEGGKAFG